MIHYHGGPITPDTCAIKAWKGRHAFISYANHHQLALASEITQSFALDNGAFTFWKTGRPIDWAGYYQFVEKWKRHPRFDFAIIPDVIDGGEKGNDELLAAWPHGKIVGVPVWHMNYWELWRVRHQVPQEMRSASQGCDPSRSGCRGLSNGEATYASWA